MSKASPAVPPHFAAWSAVLVSSAPLNVPPVGMPASANAAWSERPPTSIGSVWMPRRGVVVGQHLLERRRALRLAVRGVDEVAGVRRADHVEVHVAGDLVDLRLRAGSRRSPTTRPGPAPRRPTRRTAGAWPAAGSARRRSAPTSSSPAEPEPLSLMPGPAVDAVRVPAEHHRLVLVATRPVGDQVPAGAAGGELLQLRGVPGRVQLALDVVQARRGSPAGRARGCRRWRPRSAAAEPGAPARRRPGCPARRRSGPARAKAPAPAHPMRCRTRLRR